MSIIGSCGHELSESDGVTAIKSQSRECTNAVSYESLCKACYKLHEIEDLILYSDEECNAYLRLSVKK